MEKEKRENEDERDGGAPRLQSVVAFVIVSAELVRGLKDNYCGGTVIFTVMHTVVSKMLCKTTACRVEYL